MNEQIKITPFSWNLYRNNEVENLINLFFQLILIGIIRGPEYESYKRKCCFV